RGWAAPRARAAPWRARRTCRPARCRGTSRSLPLAGRNGARADLHARGEARVNSTFLGAEAGATAIASAVAGGAVSAAEVTRAAWARASTGTPRINALTAITADRALAEAEVVDRARAAGTPLGPLAGVPYVAKNLFDVEGLVTLAGSK